MNTPEFVKLSILGGEVVYLQGGWLDNMKRWGALIPTQSEAYWELERRFYKMLSPDSAATGGEPADALEPLECAGCGRAVCNCGAHAYVATGGEQ